MFARLAVVILMSVLLWTGTLLHDSFHDHDKGILIRSGAAAAADIGNWHHASHVEVGENHCHDVVVSLNHIKEEPGSPICADLARSSTPFVAKEELSGYWVGFSRAPPFLYSHASKLYLLHRSLLI